MADSIDAIIIGGGPAGATAGFLLARAGWSVAIIEQDVYPRRKVCGEFLSASNLPLLRLLNLDTAFVELAGPEVRRVAVFAGDETVCANMPALHAYAAGWGRALGREHLDSILLINAAIAGAKVWQPWSVLAVRDGHRGFVCDLGSRDGRDIHATLSARVVIAAHGSWLAGTLPTQPSRRAARASDLFGFKAHFFDADLPNDLMPLLTFPGGYGGMVHTDGGRISLSCCIRRDRLAESRRRFGGPAGEAVGRHITAHCSGAAQALVRAVRDGAWQSTGPIRPGIRIANRLRSGAFTVGNAAGEAHPVVAEGIGMAMQSGWLVADTLINQPDVLDRCEATDAAASCYQTRWRQSFAPRIFSSSVIAHWAMRPSLVHVTLPLLRALPGLLTEAARTTGKVSPICSPSF